MDFLHPANAEETGGWQLGGQALVRAIEALDTIEPSGWSERALAGLLMAAYKRRLRAIIPCRDAPRATMPWAFCVLTCGGVSSTAQNRIRL